MNSQSELCGAMFTMTKVLRLFFLIVKAHLPFIQAWVEQNDSSTLMEALLTCANINRFIVSPSRAHMFGRQFLGTPLLP